MPGRARGSLTLSDHERATLARWTRRARSSRAMRARIVLACADGTPNTVVAARLGVSRDMVGKWRSRFIARRLEGLSDEPRPGAPRKLTDDVVERVVATTLEQAPPRGDRRWSTRSMAMHTGLSQTAVSRIWRTAGLTPHPVGKGAPAVDRATPAGTGDPGREGGGIRSDARTNRDRVLAAAEEVFGESGKAGSTEEVARRAGVGIGTVFRHFPTKRLLVEAAIVRHLRLLTDTARARGEGGGAGAAFRMTFREMVSGAPAKLALLALLEESADPVGVTDEVAAAGAALRDAVEVLLSRGQEAGEVRADATVGEVYMLIRALSHARGDPAVVDRAVDVVLDGLAPKPDTTA